MYLHIFQQGLVHECIFICDTYGHSYVLTVRIMHRQTHFEFSITLLGYYFDYYFNTMLVVKTTRLNCLSGEKKCGFPPSWGCLGCVRPTSLCDVLRVDADGYLLALFVTGDDLGEPGETVTESPVCEALMRFVAN